MQIRIHNSYRKIVALSDIGLVGKTFEEGIRQIQIKPHFFKGEEKTKEEIIKILKKMHKEDATFNIVGKKSTQAALEAGIIKENGIMKIQDVPIALVLL
jgi:hypothetical protein